MKNQKGFIQIPLLSVIVAGVLILGGAGYFGIQEYKNYKAQEAQKELQREQEYNLLLTQQSALASSTQVLEQLKRNLDQSKKKPKIDIMELARKRGLKMPTQEITAADLQPYLSAIVQINCGDSLGSGSLRYIPGIGYGVLTNKHVVDSPNGTFDNGNNLSCLVRVKAKNGLVDLGLYDLDFTNQYKWNATADIAFQKIEISNLLTRHFAGSVPSTSIDKLNYSISSLKKCYSQMPIGSPVALGGYPAYALKKNDENDMYSLSSRILTNGVISGYKYFTASDSNISLPDSFSQPIPNYYVSAKIDSGNSGGIAFSKDENGLCVLGIPTWLSVGNYETQGIVQNIHNVMNQP